jgi:hypothetical protein
MSEIRIVTNNVPRDIVEAYELNASERAEFDYLNWAAIEADEDSASFFRYRGDLYDLGNFMRVSDSAAMAGWDGYASDSYFSGTLVKYVEDGERIIVGRYYA